MIDESTSTELRIEAAVILGSLAKGTEENIKGLIEAGAISVLLKGTYKYSNAKVFFSFGPTEIGTYGNLKIEVGAISVLSKVLVHTNVVQLHYKSVILDTVNPWICENLWTKAAMFTLGGVHISEVFL